VQNCPADPVTLAVSSVYFAWQFTPTGSAWSLALICLLAALWALYAARLELVLVTTARRRFVRGWYDAEDILSRLSTRLETERNRQDIFRVLSIEIDATFELEQAHCIVASRLPDDSLRGYQLLAADGTTLLAELAIADDFIEACQGRTEPVSLAEFSPAIQRRFATLGHARPEAALGNLETAALTEDHVAERHLHVVEHDFRVAVRRIIIAEDRQHAYHVDAGRICFDENLGLLPVLVAFGISLAHDDQDLAARVTHP
jgi:hypothetical protein